MAVQAARDRHQVAITTENERGLMCRREIDRADRMLEGGRVVPPEQPRKEAPQAGLGTRAPMLTCPIYRAPKSWCERAYHKLIYFHEVDKGGHSAAWEQPELFAQEIRAAFRSLR